MVLTTNGSTVVLLGHVGVGKTSICRAINGEPVTTNYLPTIDYDFSTEFARNGTTYHVNMIDTAGQTQFSTIDPQLLNIDYGFILVFSQATNSSLHMLHEILSKLEFQFGDLEGVSVAIVCNGSDMDKAVDDAEIIELVKQAKCPFYRTSALTDTEGVNKMFQDVVMRMEKKMSGEIPNAMHGNMDAPLTEMFLPAKDNVQTGSAGNKGDDGKTAGGAGAGGDAAAKAGNDKGMCNIM